VTKVLSKNDSEHLIASQQAVDLAQQSLAELYKSEDPLLSEHAFVLMETLSSINQKLRRLITITQVQSTKKTS